MLVFTNGFLTLRGGNLAEDVIKEVSLLPGNKIVLGSCSSLNPGKLSFKLASASGSFKGGFSGGEIAKQVKFQGVVLQNMDAGFGFFQGTNQAGRVYFGSGL